MAKYARKVAEAMARRAAAHNGVGPNQNGKHKGKKPGSQNRKRSGYGKRGTR